MATKKKTKKVTSQPVENLKTNPGIEEAIRRAGGTQTQLAELMEVEQPAVHHWLYVNCPPTRAKEIEAKLGVPRSEICPDVFG